MNQKILAIIKTDNTPSKEKYLILKANPKQLNTDNWYVVTGEVEGSETYLEALRKIVETETQLEIIRIISLNKLYTYEQPQRSGKMYHEKVFIVIVKQGEPKLSRKHIEAKWLSKKDFIEQINWYTDKKEPTKAKDDLRSILEQD